MSDIYHGTEGEYLVPPFVQEYKIDKLPAASLAVDTLLQEDDPLLCKVPLPLKAIFYPLGFAIEISTNCQRVIDAAVESWGSLQPRYAGPRLRIYFGVTDAGPEECPPAPVARAQRHLLSIVADSHNQAICDLREGFAFVWLNRSAARHSSYLRYHFLESVALVLLSTSCVVPIHAACISRYGCAMLLCGLSGAGKSTLAYGCARAGWTYISDDASYLLRAADGPRIIGNSRQFRFRPSAKAIFPELHGRSLTPRAQGKPSIEVRTADLPGILTAEDARPRCIIFLNRQPSSVAELRPLPQEAAMKYFSQNVYPTEEVGQPQIAALEYLSTMQAYELLYSDLTQAVERLEQLARSSGVQAV